MDVLTMCTCPRLATHVASITSLSNQQLSGTRPKHLLVVNFIVSVSDCYSMQTLLVASLYQMADVKVSLTLVLDEDDPKLTDLMDALIKQVTL